MAAAALGNTREAYVISFLPPSQSRSLGDLDCTLTVFSKYDTLYDPRSVHVYSDFHACMLAFRRNP